ncbi:MAG: 16S rRNA (cytosine(967)-C(5))-methyltransferase RsmB [Solobacterium sp.]|nr:16S rRNA (cytosine(967)-C(5))-methyltransferase RsmB [Solobacterium sp.]
MTEREKILNILLRVYRDRAFASLLMRRQDFSKEEAGFITECVYGTIRSRSLLEYQYAPFVKHISVRSACLLQMTVYQMFFMDSVPDYAAVSEAVGLAKKSEKGFINSVLRKVQKQQLVLPEEPYIRYSHPKWIYDLWKAHYGAEKAEAIMRSDQERAAVYGRINTLKYAKEEAEKEGFVFLDDLCFKAEGPLTQSERFLNGCVLIQNRNSQKIPAVLQPRPGMNVLDACAAPGTKTQQIAMMMGNRGSVTACDLYENRVSLIRQLMDRCGVTICEARTADASQPGTFEAESFDRILLDVPCSGLGDLCGKPEIRWNTKPEDLDAITALQAKILQANAPYLKKDGLLVYSTCTLNKKENEKQVQAFLASAPDFELLEEKTLFPDETDGDGFYYALMRKC